MSGIAWLPALAGAAVSAFLNRSGFAGFLFLLPLGVVAYCNNIKTAWFAAGVSLLANALTCFVVGRFQRLLSPGADMLYLTVVIAAFMWIASPPKQGPAFLRMPVAYRVVLGSAATSLVLALILFTAQEDQSMRFLFRSQAEHLAALYAGASGADEVQRSLMEHYVTADAILDMFRAVALRGGMAASCAALFAVSRQLSLVAAALFQRKRPKGLLASFHVRPECIWALSLSLLGIVAGVNFDLAPLEIAGWNILVLCAILYLAQGGSIAAFFLARLPAGTRFVLNMGILILLLTPGINAVFMGILILLGIAENWAPFRASKSSGPPPTPGA
jgi:hypothetical protein